MSEPSRVSLPEPDLASPVPESVVPDDAGEPVDLSHLSDEHREVVRQLRGQVERAATTIERLRAENEHLRKRVQELEGRPDVPADKTVFALDDDPAVLRDRITDFIEAIDTYLEEDDATALPTDDTPASDIDAP